MVRASHVTARAIDKLPHELTEIVRHKQHTSIFINVDDSRLARGSTRRIVEHDGIVTTCWSIEDDQPDSRISPLLNHVLAPELTVDAVLVTKPEQGLDLKMVAGP